MDDILSPPTSKFGTGGECDLGTIQLDTIINLFFFLIRLSKYSASPFFVCFSIQQDRDWWRCLEDVRGKMGANLECGQAALIQNYIFSGERSSWSAV